MQDGLPGRDKAVLAFWGKNLCMIHDLGMSWPGFSYTKPEWVRLAVLSQAVSRFANAKFKAVNAVVFIAIAGAAMFGGFLPVASALFPVPAETPAAQFLVLLATFAAVILGFGLPVSMRIAAWFSANPAAIAGVPDSPEDPPLARKVRFQMWRMIVIMCGILVPGAMLLITYNINLGPAVTVMKWLSIGLMAFSSWWLRYARASQRTAV